ncbi:MAG: hypothetical protein ACE5E0_06960 [Terriglobia bacterium]
MNAEFTFLCDATTIDRDGKINALGIFERLSAEEFPLSVFRIMLLVSLFGEDSEAGTHDLELKLFSPDNKEIIPPMTMKFDLPAGSGKSRIVSELNSVEFEKAGEYIFDIIVNKKSITKVPLTIVHTPSTLTPLRAVKTPEEQAEEKAKKGQESKKKGTKKQ